MAKPKSIEVRAAHTQTAVFNHQCVVVQPCDTIAEAKALAKRVLTEEYQHNIETSEPLRYSQVIVDGECHTDYFRKGYNGDDCPNCRTKLLVDEQYATFRTPPNSTTVKLRMHWCPDCQYEHIEIIKAGSRMP